MKLGKNLKDRATILPSVDPHTAARQIVDFIESVGADTVLFHGEDMLCLDPFMANHGKDEEWGRCSQFRVNTGEFFKQVQNEINEKKFKMSVITALYGRPALVDIYEEGQHGALVDAEVLGQLCCGRASRIRVRFAHWLGQKSW